MMCLKWFTDITELNHIHNHFHNILKKSALKEDFFKNGILGRYIVSTWEKNYTHVNFFIRYST